MFWKTVASAGSRYEMSTPPVSSAAASKMSQSSVAQCRRTRMTLRSVPSRYSSGSLGANTCAFSSRRTLEEVLHETDQRLGPTTKCAKDIVHQTGSLCGGAHKEEEHQRHAGPDQQLLQVHG